MKKIITIILALIIALLPALAFADEPFVPDYDPEFEDSLIEEVETVDLGFIPDYDTSTQNSIEIYEPDTMYAFETTSLDDIDSFYTTASNNALKANLIIIISIAFLAISAGASLILHFKKK